jgi:hypothetical protein
VHIVGVPATNMNMGEHESQLVLSVHEVQPVNATLEHSPYTEAVRRVIKINKLIYLIYLLYPLNHNRMI